MKTLQFATYQTDKGKQVIILIAIISLDKEAFFYTVDPFLFL